MFWDRLKLAAAWICGYDIDRHYNFACNNLLTPIGWKWYRLHVGTVSQGRARHRLCIISKDPKPPADLLSAELSIWDLFYMYILNGAVHLSYINHLVTTDKHMTVISYIIILRGEVFQEIVCTFVRYKLLGVWDLTDY